MPLALIMLVALVPKLQLGNPNGEAPNFARRQAGAFRTEFPSLELGN